MALTTESAGKVRQKTYAGVRNPLVYASLKALFLHLATNKGNPDLQYVNFNGSSVDDSGGEVLCTDPCRLWAVYGKKTATDEDVYLAFFDDATDDAGAGTDGRLVLPFLISGEEELWTSPNGLSLATGCVAKAYTDFDGTTDSTAGASPNGFVIISAP